MKLKKHWAMNNTAGKPDVLFTFATIGFLVTTACIVLSMFSEINIGKDNFHIHTPDSTLLLGYLSATFTAYVVRRSQGVIKEEDGQVDNVEKKVDCEEKK